jgi:ubiquinone/menaquinone biosynthesis C-methylase UbiE
MNEPPHAPDSDLVYSLYANGWKPQLVRIALLLDVFTPLANGPADAHAVARACDCDVFGIRTLLDYLSSLRLLERKGSTYALSPTAAAFLVPRRPTYAGDWVLSWTDPEMWDGMLEALRSGRPSYHALPYAQDQWLESYRPWRPAKSLEMWRAAGIEPGRRSGLRVLDVACGCAMKSLVLAQADPTVHVTCVDSPEVLKIARNLAERLEVVSQVTFLPGDLHAIDLGDGRYDAALLGQITDALTPEQNTGLFRRVYKALSVSGMLVIDVFMAPKEPTEGSGISTLLAWALHGGAAHSFADYRRWLEDTGFKQVNHLSERWLSAIK